MEIRYVGKSTRGLIEPKFQMNMARTKLNDGTYRSHRYVHNWIRKLQSSGLKYRIEILEVFSNDAADAELDSAEIKWISHYRSLGNNLTNLTEGGGGISNPSQSTRDKLRKQKLGDKNPMFGKPGTMLGVSGPRHPVYGTKQAKAHKEKNRYNSAKQVLCVEDGREFKSIKAAMDFYGIPRYRIVKSCNSSLGGKGFVWIEK